MEPDGGQNSSEYVGKHATFKLMGNFSSIHIIRKRRRAVDEDDHYCSKRKHIVRMLFSHRLVAFISCILLCLIPDPVRTFPFDGSLVEGASGSLSNSHRSHMDLLIDPIHQAEYGDEELESKKVVAKSVFDMVLRTPPPPTSSSTRCPPGTQSPFEGGPCIKKSTDPVALVDQTFLLDTLRGLTRDGVLLGGGSSRTRRPGGGGGHNRRRPTGRTKMPTTATTATTIMTTTQPPTTTMTTEIPPETTFMRDVSDSALSEVRQPYDSSIDMIPESLNSYVTTDNPKSLDIISVEDHVRSGDDNFSDERKADSGLNIDEITLITTSATTDNESDTDQEMTTLSLPTEIPTAIMKDYPEIGINGKQNYDGFYSHSSTTVPHLASSLYTADGS